jgi:hypothetical protein
MINLLCILIDHLTGILYNDDSQTVNDLMANGRTCESLPGVNTSYFNVYNFYNHPEGDRKGLHPTPLLSRPYYDSERLRQQYLSCLFS